MIWQALAQLAVSDGRRLSWRDLSAHASQVPVLALPEVAVATLREHGVQARIQQLPDVALGLAQLRLPVALRVIGGHWLVVTALDGLQARVRVFDGSSHPSQALSEPGQEQNWPLEKLLSLSDGLCINVPESATASTTEPNEADALSPEAPKRDWFWGVFAQLRAHYGDCIVVAVLVNLLSLAGSMFSMNVYDRIIPNAAMHSLWTLAIGVMLAAGVELLLRSLRAHVLDDAGKRADLALSASLMRQTLNLRPGDRPASSGQWASQLRDFDSVRDFVSSTTMVALTDLPFALLFLVVIAWMGGPLVWITLAAGLLTVMVGALTQWPIRRSVERYQYENTQKHAYLIESLERLETIEALGASSAVQGRWERLSAAAARSAMTTRMASAFTNNASQSIQQLASVALIIAGVYQILANQLTVGALIACSILASRVLSPLGQVAGLMARWQTTRMSFQQVDKLMRLPPKHDPLKTFVAWPAARQGQAFEMSLQNLRFCYPRSEQEVLRIDQLTLQAGQIVVVTGPVGSGKSTLLRVLAGLQWPSEGQILVGGIAAGQISPAEWRAHVGWVGQDAVLFRGSLRDNLLLAAPQVSDERLLQVLRLCGLDRLAAAHPQGLDMPVGEGGQSLSGGQRQWVALARALLANAPVLLLDEPTSAMDMAFEQLLLERLRPELQGKLVVLSTHRPGPLILADRMLILDAGRIIADGPRDAVLHAVAQGRVDRASAATDAMAKAAA